MKKILLATTALLTLCANVSSAEDVTVSFNGSSVFEAGARKVDKDHKQPISYSPNQNSTAFYTKQAASLKAEGKQDSLTYGAILRLQMVANSNDGTGDYKTNRSYLYLDTDAGAVQLGSNAGASAMMKIDAGTIASATGGVDGDWGSFADTSSVISAKMPNGSDISDEYWNGSSIAITGGDAASNINDSLVIGGVDTLANRLDTGESSRKITYLSPRISGLQLAASFTPDVSNNGSSDVVHSGNMNGDGAYNGDAKFYMGSPVRVKNLWSLGMNYNKEMNDINFGFSAVMDKGIAKKQFARTTGTGTDQNVNFKNLQTYAIGTSVSAHGVTAAVSYQNDGDSLTVQGMDKFKAHWWTAGLAYAYGDFTTSVNYLDGKKGTTTQNVKTKLASWGLDYQAAPGLMPFGEVTMIRMKPQSKDTSDSQLKTTVFILGMKLKF